MIKTSALLIKIKTKTTLILNGYHLFHFYFPFDLLIRV